MTSIFKRKTDPNQTRKKACVLKQLSKPLVEVREVKFAINLLQKVFHQFRVFVFDFILKNENAESAESSAKFLMQRFHAIFIGTFLCN